MCFIHIFDTNLEAIKYYFIVFFIFKDEIRESLKLKVELCRYDERY